MPLFPPRQPKKISPRVGWRIENFRNAIWAYGQPVLWEMAGRCPCRQFATNDVVGIDENLGHSQANCVACNGSGTLYHSAQETTALCGQMSRDAKLVQAYGDAVMGGATFTMFPENRPHHLDRLTLTKTVTRYDEVRMRHGTTEQPRYPIVKRTIELADYADPTEGRVAVNGVLYIRTADSSGKVGAELVEDTDYTVNDDGTVTWLETGNPPAAGGGLYSISYWAHPVYVVKDMGFSARDTFVAFKSVSPQFKEMVTAVTMAWLEIMGRPGWHVDGSPG